ncbi:MAG: Riboflavin biosynthesis protein RibD [Actinobacteria bacterium ADurb.Bin346]|nr:MAG: Riboflavin biosynthesis protein RibD [Actinobacteria bacterium ADurb.Bin346]
MNFSAEDKRYMKLAISIAEKARGFTSPNPMVGAVIVKDGKMLSSGYHKKAGSSHAEVEAINACPDKKLLAGATMYVSLEPCCIYGKTPPCTEAIIKNGISRVVAACRDPNPEVSGRGFEILKAAGVIVDYGLLEERAKKQNEIFFKSITSGRPFVTIKIASSLDGRTALDSGNSKWITSEKSRRLVQKMRLKNDCILTGINTVLTDDPLLHLRIAKTSSVPLKSRKFLRAILDSSLRISPQSKIACTSERIKTIVFTSSLNNEQRKKAALLKKMGMEITEIKELQKQKENTDITLLDLSQILKILHDNYEVTSVLVEAGQMLCSSFLKNKLFDKMILFMAPKIIGNDSRYGMFGNLSTKLLSDCPVLEIESVKNIDGDLMITAYPKKKNALL